jgi:hypothetical protein
MKRKCSYCGREVRDDKAVTCPKCNTILPERTDDAEALTQAQEERIAIQVAKSLSDNWSFIVKVFGLTIIGITVVWTVIGFFYGFTVNEQFRTLNNNLKTDATHRLAELDIELGNKIASVQYSIETNIAAQFKDKRIKEIMSVVAVNQASNLLLQQISPQIEKFQAETSNTIVAFNESLTQFEKNSTNALLELKQATEFSLLVSGVNSDDFAAYEKLSLIESTNLFSKQAVNLTFLTIDRMGVETLPNPNVSLMWNNYGVDLKSAPIEQIKRAYDNAGDLRYTKKIMLEDIFNQTRFSKRERMEFCVSVLENSPSILLRAEACYLLDQEIHSNHHRLNVQWYIDWWNANKDKYTNDVPATTK